MRHKKIRKKLLRYLDNDLLEKEKLEVQCHLENCRSCQDDLKTVEMLWFPERLIERKSAPPFLWTRISARIQSEAKQGFLNELKKPVWLALRPVVMVAMFILIFFSGIKLGNLMIKPFGEGSEISAERSTDNFGMGYFEISPPGSIDADFLE
ncbi:zf-HC2 domain-containing protein [candidate division KSB1 bacterium]|nr:zf-HC2 domain-containing protein [candidate division KSB1 bacterium]